MFKANLAALNLTVPIGLFRVYHDDGYVDSIQEHAEKLMAKYHMTDMGAPPAEDFGPSCAGRHTSHQTMFAIHHHIYYKKSDSDVEDIMIRAHEETHFLDDSKKLDYLVKEIMENHGIKIDFKSISESEVRAYIGSIYALLSRGIILDKPQKDLINPKYRTHFIEARRLFEHG